jgi:phage terminase large subunit-like protein
MNNFILEYYQNIKDGSEKVGEYITKWYEYLVKGLETKSFYFNQKKAAKAVKYIENYCHHHEGDLAPNLVQLELWQKAFISVIFGIVDSDGNRQFREVVLVVGRKCGKTLLAAAIADYVAFCDGEYGARIYFCAPKLEQARLCYDAFVQMVSAEPELNSLAKKRRSDIYIESFNTSIQPLAFNAKKSDGLNPHLVVCDEFAAWQGDAGLKQYEVLKSALGARRQPMILSISTANYVEGVYDELTKRGTAVLMGTSKETRLAPFIYQIDDVTKWNDINELKKSMPNLNVSVSVDYMLEEIAIAEGSLSKKAEFLTKYCNIKQNSAIAWLNAEDIEECYGEALDLNDFKGCYAVMGIDLSRTTDLTAAVLLVERDGKIHTFARFYLPANKIEEATQRDGIPYQTYVQRGFLYPSGENFIDYQDVFAWARELIEKYKIYVLQVGYDRYSSQYLIQDMKNYGFHCDDVFQGENLTPVIRETEGLIKDRKINIGNNDLLKLHFYNSALKINSETERMKLIKIETRSHIDGMAAFLCAMTVRQKWWNEIGRQLVNERR